MARSGRRSTSRALRSTERRIRRPPTAWHLPFGALVEWRCPKWIEVALEALLQRESQRVDQLYTSGLVRRAICATTGRCCGARITSAVVGYRRGAVRCFGLVLVDLDVVGEAERDDYVRAFGVHAVETTEVVQWLRRHTNLLENTMLSPKELAGHEDMIRKIAQSIPARYRFEGLSAEQREELLRQLNPEEVLPLFKFEDRLSGLTPEERLRDLTPEEAILALPDAVLRGFSEEYLATLSERARKTIRKRLRAAKTKR